MSDGSSIHFCVSNVHWADGAICFWHLFICTLCVRIVEKCTRMKETINNLGDIMNANDWIIAVKYWIRDLIINFAKCLVFFLFCFPSFLLSRAECSIKWGKNECIHANDGKIYQQMNQNRRRNCIQNGAASCLLLLPYDTVDQSVER